MIRNGCVGNFTLILLALISNHSVLCFVFRKSCNTLGKVTTAQHLASDPDLTNGSLTLPDLPSIEQIKSESFMQQVGYGQVITEYLDNVSEKDSEYTHLSELVKAQFQHKDGIRGFFVSYLTSGSEDEDSEFVVPNILINAMKEANEETGVFPKDLISLACMNVIMPVATATMHKDPILAQSSKRTASRAVKVLMTLLDNSETIKNCEAIYTASIHDGKTISGDDNSLVKYWIQFMENYNYGEKQRKDISLAFESLTNP